MKSFKVIHILFGMKVGGVQKLLLNTLPILKSKGIDVEVVCTREKGEWADLLEKNGIPVHLVKVKKKGWKVSTFRDILKLSIFLSKHRPSMVHLHGYPTNLRTGLATIVPRIPFIMHYHSLHTNRGFLDLAIEKLLLSRTSKIVAVSNTVAKNIIERTKLPLNNIQIIYNGAGGDQTDRNSLTVSDPRTVSYPRMKHKYNVIMVSRLAPVKRVSDFVKMAHTLEQKWKNLGFMLVGGGTEKQEKKIVDLCKELKVKSVYMAGKRNDVGTILKTSDLGVLTSSKEGHSIVVIEYLNSGLPVVVSRISALEEMVLNAKCGLFSEVGNYLELSAAVETLLSNPLIRAKMKFNNLRRSRKFSTSQTIKHLWTLYLSPNT